MLEVYPITDKDCQGAFDVKLLLGKYAPFAADEYCEFIRLKKKRPSNK